MINILWGWLTKLENVPMVGIGWFQVLGFLREENNWEFQKLKTSVIIKLHEILVKREKGEEKRCLTDST